jgi:predicted  nucleic acid-binding Zn-ribbon protein
VARTGEELVALRQHKVELEEQIDNLRASLAHLEQSRKAELEAAEEAKQMALYRQRVELAGALSATLSASLPMDV